MRKICIFTSTRSEWGLLRGVAERIRQSERLQLLVSGSHLSEKLGMTIQEIVDAGFPVDARVDILKFDDSPGGICKTMGLALSGSGEALAQLKPDLLVILGDRYESFCAAAAAQILRIPIAHIHGGETTEGAVDEAFRHSITKMSQLHFPSCEEYRRRIIQLGENPARVFNVGALGIENIRKISLMSRAELEESIQFKLNKPFFLVTFHPVTLENATAGTQFNELLAALEQFPEHKIIFTKANADTDGHVINEKMDAYAAARPERCLAVASLGLHRYLAAMKICDAVVGNSSSGILEAPAFGVPTVNIGDRQKGRLRVKSIIDCEPNSEAIVSAIQKALDAGFRHGLRGMIHPCEQAGTSGRIVQILENAELNGLLKKTFYDLEDC
jgi:GDP/UDP-N,N'-diacetylbacillosamine 2-epimerase (hydrolysing)